MSNENEILSIKRLCIINFLELQEIRRKLNIATTSNQDFYDYANEVSEYMKDLDNKINNLTKDYPHLADK